MLRYLLLFALVVLSGTATADDRPIFDAHIHYSHDAVELVPPEQVARILRDAGVRKALVSSSDDNGTQLLLDAAPDIIVPALRPYRRRGEINTWMHDETVVDYLESNLAKNEYEAIGEFHAYGSDIKTPVIQHMIALAKERNLILHHHGDREAVDLIFETWPEARVLWAHSGFVDPESVVDALDTHPRLWADLAFRSDMISQGRVDPGWKAAFEGHPDRFLVGTDTFAPERWYYVGPHADYSREWLSLLPDQIADNIAYANAERMLATE